MFHYFKKAKIHFIGIGGIGMSGIAEVLLELGHFVSGSDINESATIYRLRALGADIAIGHHVDNLQSPTVVVYSSAITPDNPEFMEAQRRQWPLIRRAEMLAELMRLKFGLAVAGSHGKTTTTSLLATILHAADLNPTHIIGGVVENLGGHAKLGQSDIMVAEADESDGSFLLLGPIMAIITNIDNDHLDHYQDFERISQAFLDFANRIPFYGRCILNAHDVTSMKFRSLIKRPTVTFGVIEEADYCAKAIEKDAQGSSFDFWAYGQLQGRVRLPLLGIHNIFNALGAMALARELDVPFSAIQKGLLSFKGVGRRLEVIFSERPLTIIDDYAHHPTEVSTTINAVKESSPDRLIVIFQPHRYTRTLHSWKDFLHCFNGADEVYLLPIYAASERPIPGVTAERLALDIKSLHPGLVHYAENLDCVDKLIDNIKQNGKDTTLLCLGAGSIGKEMRKKISFLS